MLFGYVSAKILATDYLGRQATTETSFGIDRVFKDENGSGGYFVVATNRENERLIGFDKVHLVTFEESGPRIRDVIPDSGFGEYVINEWIYIPQHDRGENIVEAKDLQLFRLYADGEKRDEWLFGKALIQRNDWKDEFTLFNLSYLERSNFLLEFNGTQETHSQIQIDRWIS